MTHKSYPRAFRALPLFLVLVSALAVSKSVAQEEEVYELSPFSVDASDQSGYTATHTLAGTRIRTQLKDLGSAISVYTGEFLEDTGATDAGTLLSYTTNAEVGGINGNFSGAEDTGTGRYVVTEARTNPQLNQRIRGLGAADLTRGFYLTDIPFDSYNTESVTVSRGPNSLLFGIGSPGGVIDNATKQALLNTDVTEAAVRFDNHGSLRGEFDINRRILNDRVALRIAGLDDHIKYRQEPAWNRDQRIYVALEALLSKNEDSEFLGATRYKANYEEGQSRGSPVEIIPPTAAYHSWFEPAAASIEQYTGVSPAAQSLSPSDGGTWEFQATYNPFISVNGSAESDINTNNHPTSFRTIPITFSQPDAQVPNQGLGNDIVGQTLIIPWNRNLDTLDSTGLAGTPAAIDAFGPDAPGDTPMKRTSIYHPVSIYAEPWAVGFAAPSINNREVFDYRNLVFSGGIDNVKRNFDAINLALEQNFLDDNLGIEIAYDKQHYDYKQDFLFSGQAQAPSTTGPYDVYVSVNEFTQNGQVNPNLGRAYTRLRTPAKRLADSDRETFRVTAFGELDLTDNDGWMKHLGRHRITGLFNDYTLETNSSQRWMGWASNDFDIGAALQGDPINHFRRPVTLITYVSDDLRGLGSVDDVRLSQINIPHPQDGDTYTVAYADTSSAGAARRLSTGQAIVKEYLQSEDIGKTDIEATAFAWQSYFFDEHIVGLYGLRTDDVQSFVRANESEVGFDSRIDHPNFGVWNPDFTRLSATPALDESGDTTTWSVIARYPEAWLGELPGGMDLQFHYAESENFNPVEPRGRIDGGIFGQPTGTTEEYGFLASFNRFTVKVNWFETSLNLATAGPNVNLAGFAAGRINSYRDSELVLERPWQAVLDDTVENQAGFPVQSYDDFYPLAINAIPQDLRDNLNARQVDTDNDGVWDTYVIDPIPNLSSTQDRVAEGFEVELNYNPTQNWRILANISKQETINSNTANLMAFYEQQYTSALVSSRIAELPFDATGTQAIRPMIAQWGNVGVVSIRTAKALDGTVSNEQRTWRFTGVTSYGFTEGFLSGSTIGGALRWEDEAATGYLYRVVDDIAGPDVTRPYFDDGLFSGDLWMSYATKVWNDRVNWKIQLNIRNLIGENDDIPVKTNPDGQIAAIRIPNPMTISLTNTFSF
jgi:outer membrane receptor protein involved in Fe transport